MWSPQRTNYSGQQEERPERENVMEETAVLFEEANRRVNKAFLMHQGEILHQSNRPAPSIWLKQHNLTFFFVYFWIKFFWFKKEKLFQLFTLQLISASYASYFGGEWYVQFLGNVYDHCQISVARSLCCLCPCFSMSQLCDNTVHPLRNWIPDTHLGWGF